MTADQFVCWLRGYVQGANNDQGLKCNELAIVMSELDRVELDAQPAYPFVDYPPTSPVVIPPSAPWPNTSPYMVWTDPAPSNDWTAISITR